MGKDIIIVYDKKNKDVAQIAEAILSSVEGFKAVLLENEMFKQQPQIDKQRCLFIGYECSKHLKFHAKYIHKIVALGWVGKKAWIRSIRDGFCDMDNEAIETFFEEYKTLCDKFDVRFSAIEYKQDALVLIKAVTNFINLINHERLWVAIMSFSPIYVYSVYKKMEKLDHYIHLYGVLLFIDKYLKLFLEEGKQDEE